MGYIKEPFGIDFMVGANQFTIEDRKMISEVIANIKATGQKKTFNKTIKRKTVRKQNSAQLE
jgi:hypothetical protein